MADLTARILAKLDARDDEVYWLFRDVLQALLALHSDANEDHFCPSELVGYSVQAWHDAADPCPTLRAIAEKLGVEVDGG